VAFVEATNCWPGDSLHHQIAAYHLKLLIFAEFQALRGTYGEADSPVICRRSGFMIPWAKIDHLEHAGGLVAKELKKTSRTTISRHSERASYDRELAYAILDEGMVAHVGFEADGSVVVVPMTYARVDDQIVLHGAVASRWLSSFEKPRPVSVCVTLLDGLVLAQSAFSHSMNYRSIVVLGDATLLTSADEKQTAFKAFVDHLIPGRWEDSRQPDHKEVVATTVLSVPIVEASVKVRSGPPKDSAKDLGLGYWTGVIPLKLTAGEPVVDPVMTDDLDVPAYVADFQRLP